MFDIGWTEFAVIAVVALIVIGPKDLPVVLKTLGTWIRKARMLTREFQSSVDDMIREAELDEVRKQALELKQMNVSRQIEKTIDPTGTLRNAFDPEADSTSGKKAGPTEAQAAIAATPAPTEPPVPPTSSAQPPAESPAVTAPAVPPAGPAPKASADSTASAANEKQA
ncbi:MAG TPA: Sec-independent protein translocase protein TatB [Arenibaculum sp.]|nr:Sec-independent protein translocase protein TatB [Arenibaculum sp.]